MENANPKPAASPADADARVDDSRVLADASEERADSTASGTVGFGGLSTAKRDDTMEPSDRSLVARIQDGDEAAASILYHRYAARLFGLVRVQMGGLLQAKTEPDDVVQSVFRTLFRHMHLGHYDAPDGNSLWGLLSLTTVRKIQSYGQHWAAQCRNPSNESSVSVNDGEVTDGVSSPSTAQIELVLREFLDSLREFDRDVLTMRLEGRSVGEIAEATGRSRRSVERSLQKLRTILADEFLADDSRGGEAMDGAAEERSRFDGGDETHGDKEIPPDSDDDDPGRVNG